MASDETAREDVFNVSAFLKFLFCVLFLFVCCLTLMLYVNKVAAFCVTEIMRYFVLPKHTKFHVRGFHLAPLRARIFFQQLFFENENYSVRVVDGYFTFALWNSWFQDTQWTKVHDYMFSPDLIGMRCRVMLGFKTVKGTIREVDLERQKITVELDAGPSWSDEEEDDEEDDAQEEEELTTNASHSDTDPTTTTGPDRSNQPDTEHEEVIVGLDDGMADHLNRPFETSGAYYSSVGRKNADARANVRRASGGTPAAAAGTNGKAGGSTTTTAAAGGPGERSRPTPHRASTQPGSTAIRFNSRRGGMQGGTGDKVLKVYDISDVSIRNRPGRCQLHLNGMRVCLFNATGKYEDLRNDSTAAAKPDGEAKDAAREVSPHVQRLQRFFRRRRQDTADLDDAHTDAARVREREQALKLQQHQLKHKSFMQKVFDIVRCIEIETSVSCIDMGGVGSGFPYFLRTAFRVGEGRVYLTQSGVPNIDLYRLVAELTLQQVDMRMVPMDNTLTENQLMRNPTFLERTHLLFRGTADRHNNKRSSFLDPSVLTEASEVPDLIRDFGIILDGKDRSDIHLVYFRDAPNVYAGEEVVRGKLPTSSVEVLIDAQRLRYGPWLEYCRMKLWNFFLPPNFRPLQTMEFEIGKPRPVCGFDMFVEFMTNTTLEVPFKRRAPAPSPPFGIRDSKRKGMMSATIGKGSQYIQPAFFLLKGERKQRLEGLFLGKNVGVRANAVLDRDNVELCSVETVQFFLDREDDIIWNGRKRWNILTHLFNAEVFYYMSYVDFFLDLLNDWQFSENMYHNVPLRTETFNTLQRGVRDFIPNVKRFEVFVDKVTFHVNVNTNNVIYSENPNDPDQNIIATLTARNGSFNMILPSDQYQLAAENEVVRPLQARAEDVEAFLSLPKLHPLSSVSSSEIRWAYARSMDIRGSFTCIVPCQTQPVPTDNLNEQTGRTRLHNYLNLEVDITNVEGRLMGQHIMGLVNALQNLFLDHTLPIAPDELFWLLAKLQSHVALGQNKRKEFKQFLESKQPAGNDLEVAVSVTLRNVDAVACVGQGRTDPGLNVCTSLLNFSYIKQFAVTDTCVTVSPITARFIDERGHIVHSPNAFICVGDIAVSLIKHFGPMPFKPKVHESMDVKVQGVTFSADVLQLMGLAQTAQIVLEHLKAEDPVMEAEVNEAHSVAEYAADQIAPQSPGPKYGLRRRQNTSGSPTTPGSPMSVHFADTSAAVRVDPSSDIPGSTASTAAPPVSNSDSRREPANREGDTDSSTPRPLIQAYEEKDYNTKHTQGAFVEHDANADAASQQPSSPHGPFSLGFADEVPLSVAQEYADFMERVDKAEEASKDYGIFCTLVTVGAVEGAIQAGDAGFVTVHLPWGLTAATTTLNDGNSSNRLSVAAREFSVRALASRDLDAVVEAEQADLAATSGTVPQSSKPNPASLHSTSSSGVHRDLLKQYDKYLEVFLIQTSLCVRHYTAYPFDGGLDNHRIRQQQFVQENDYEQLITFAFETPETNPRTSPTAQRRGTAAPGPRGDATVSTPAQAPSSTAPPPHSPVRPASAPPQDPPTLARKPKDEDSKDGSHAPAVAALTRSRLDAAALPADAFTNALVHFSEAADPLFPSPNRASTAGDTPERVQTTAPRQSVRAPPTTRNAPAAEVGSVHSLQSGGGSVHARSPRSDSAASGDTTVHVPARDLSSLSSATSDDGNGQSLLPGFGVDFEDANCASGTGVFGPCRSASTASDTSGLGGSTGSSSSIFAERVQFERDSDDLAASGSTFLTGPLSPSSAKPTAAGSAAGSAGAEPPKPPRPLTAVAFERRTEHNFFCAYFRLTPTPGDANTHSVLDFTSMRASRTAPHREWVHANAPLPSPSFLLYSVPTGFPDYVLSEQFMQTHFTRESDLYNWATRQANNSERSAHQSTTKHLHVELMEPVQVLLSRQFACLMGSILDTIDDTQQMLTTVLKRTSTAFTQDRNGTDFIGIQEQVRKRNAAAFFRANRNKTKSRARTRQKRWLTEDRIVTAIIPCVELKLLSALPVPVENAPVPGRATTTTAPAATTTNTGKSLRSSAPPAPPPPPFGIYSSTFAIRDVQLIMGDERPPAGVVESPADAVQKMSVSLSITSLALITQIEQEPLEREGNLSVEIPDLPYDDLKDTISVFYITNVQARMKQDSIRGANGGACSIAIDTIALHASRELVDYADHLQMVLVPHCEHMVTKARDVATAFSTPLMARSAVAPPQSPALSRMASVRTEPRTPVIVDRSRTLQGKASVACVRLSMTDTRRQGDRIVVDVAHPSSITVAKISTNFALVIPNHRPGQPECINVTTVGEIGRLESKIYPSVVHSLQPRDEVIDWDRLYAERLDGRGGAKAGATASHVSFEDNASSPGSPRTPASSATPEKFGPQRPLSRLATPTAASTTAPTSPAGGTGANRLKPKRQWVYNLAFTLRTLDAIVAHSTLNYAQLSGRNLTGGAESRLEPIRSRECVQMEVLTESISPRLKERLRFLAHKARQRAKRSRYPAPPSTTAQLQLYSTASFFTQTLIVRYVVDPVLHNTSRPTARGVSGDAYGANNSGSRSAGSPRDAPGSGFTGAHVSDVIVATVEGVSVGCHFSHQYDILGEQIDVHAIVSKIVVSAPHHTHADQTVNPQLVQFITSWRSAAKKVQTPVGGRGAAGAGGSGVSRQPSLHPGAPTTPSKSTAAGDQGSRRAKQPTNQALVLRLQVKQMEAALGLPQGISQTFVLPQLCMFLRASSNERVNLKLHAHPFSIVGKTSAQEAYCVTLPNVFLIYSHDAIKMTSSVMMEPVSITITPLFVNHALLGYEKLTTAIGALVAQNVPLDDRGNVTHHAPSPLAAVDPRGGGSVLGTSTIAPKVSIRRGRRCSFLFLWQGFRFSYLTSMSNLRLSLRKLNAIGESSQLESRKTLEWTINVTGAQIALVDRDYHDKRDYSAAANAPLSATGLAPSAAFFDATSNVNESRASYTSRLQARPLPGPHRDGQSVLSGAFPPSTAAGGTGAASAASAPPSMAGVAGAQSHGVSPLDPLAGYVWGSLELNFTLSGGKTDRDSVKQALINTSFTAYTEEMQSALMSKLGTTNAWWDLAISSPLVMLRIGLIPLLENCYEETKRDISFMKQAAKEESRTFGLRLNRHQTFHRLQKEKRRYETLINRNRQEQLEQLKRMTGQVALDLQRRRTGISQGPGWDSTLYDLDVSNTHRFVATVTNFMIILPFGDNAFRSVLDELPEAFTCHRTDKHMHTVSCLDRRRFLPTLAFKSKIENTSFICEMTSTKSLQLIPAASATTTTTTAGAAPHSGPVSPLSDAPAGAVVASHKFVGRFLATDTMLYFSPGSAVNATTDGLAVLRTMSRSPFLLGGDGNLAGSDTSEYNRARNTVHITSVDAPVHIKSTREATSVAVMLDMSGPRVRLSPHFVTLMMELSREFPSRHLHLQPRDPPTPEPSTAPATPSVGPHATPPSPTLAKTSAQSVSESDSTLRLLTVDVSARLEAGDISLFSYGLQEEPDESDGTATASGSAAATAAAAANGRRGSTSDSVFARGRFPVGGSRSNEQPASYNQRAQSSRVLGARAISEPTAAAQRSKSTTFSSRKLPRIDRRKSSVGGPLRAAPEETMKCVLQIPLPTVLVQVLVRRSNIAEEDDVAAVRGEIHAGLIELGPSLGVVAREIEQTATMHQHNIAERRKNLAAVIQALEKAAAQAELRLPVPVRDLLLPIPRAYLSAVLADRTQRMTTIHRRRRQRVAAPKPAPGSSPTPNDTNNDDDSEDGRALDLNVTVNAAILPRRRFVTDVQVTLADLRLVFSVEPFASTAFTVFLDDRGSVDVVCRVVKEYRHPMDLLPFIKKDPSLSIIVNVRRLRAECQTKLEVKSLEISLPEAELVVSLREGTVGSIRSVAVNFPFNAEGSEPNLTLRMQHMAQIFTVSKIWTRIVTDTKESIQLLAQEGAKMQSGAAALTRRLGEVTATPADLGTDARVMVVIYLSHGIFSVDMGSGNAHQLLFGAIRCALEQCQRTDGAVTYLLETQVQALQMRSEGVLSGFATVRNVAVQGFLIRNDADAEEFLRSPEDRTFRATVIVQRVHVSFKERQLKDIFECRVGDLTMNMMDGIGVDGYTTSDIEVSLSKGTLGVTPSTVPALLTVLRGISAVVSDQQTVASDRISAAVIEARKLSQNAQKAARRRASSAVAAARDPAFSWVVQTRRDSADTALSIDSVPNRADSHASSPGPQSPVPQSPPSPTSPLCFIAYLGNRIPRIPCGQLLVTLENTQLLLGAISSGQAASGCVVANFSRALFSYAETPCEDYTAAKKVLIIETHNTELYRPGATKVVILGFQGDNHFEFYTRQVLGQKDVGFTLTLRQTHPWTGNPRFRDFEEMITLVKSFTDKKNVKAFKQFGHVDARFPLDAGGDDDDDNGDGQDSFRRASPQRSTTSRGPSVAASASKRPTTVALVSEKQVAEDVRVLKALRTSKFSPQLRFGGDVSVNTEVILNWIGITEKMLPAVINGQLCDKLEMALYSLGTKASEQIHHNLDHDPATGTAASDHDSLSASPPATTVKEDRRS